jgi:uncharacterized protein (TIGR04222 family)
MIEGAFEFFPFNMASGPAFLLFYLLLAVAGLGMAVALGERQARAYERRLQPPANRRPDGTPYRSPEGTATRFGLGRGLVPEADHCLAVAYLRGGRRAVCETLVAQSLAEGWLRQGNSGLYLGERSIRPGAVTKPLADALAAAGNPDAHSPQALSAAALQVAKVLEPELQRQLADAHLLRPAVAHLLRSGIIVLGGALIGVIGLIRATRGTSLHRPIGFLVFEMFAGAVACVLLAIRQRPSVVGLDYLGWLKDATTSMREEVTRRRRSEANDVSLAVAMDGVQAMPSGMQMAFPAAALAAIFAPSSSSNNSSSSSDGGGGGGGGGCGGGGCGG